MDQIVSTTLSDVRRNIAAHGHVEIKFKHVGKTAKYVCPVCESHLTVIFSLDDPQIAFHGDVFAIQCQGQQLAMYKDRNHRL